MREKLNENPVAQIALIAILALVGGYLLLSGMGGEEEAESPTAGAVAEAAPESAAAPTAAVVPTSAPVPAGRPLPDAVEDAYARGATIVLLVIRDGGIEDAIVRDALGAVRNDPEVALFVVKAKEIARYAAIAGPLGVDRVPALIVVRPKRLNGTGPAPATVSYGFRRADDVEQAVHDAVYQGPILTYAPD